MAKFRFEDMEIWKLSIEIGDQLFDIADELQEKKKFRFAEQLYGAGMSFSNNIAEGAGSFSDKDFANFLNIARRSVFECANILIVLQRRTLVQDEVKEKLFDQLDSLSRMITNFRKNLLKNNVQN